MSLKPFLGIRTTKGLAQAAVFPRSKTKQGENIIVALYEIEFFSKLS
jgi:hypothetical protein